MKHRTRIAAAVGTTLGLSFLAPAMAAPVSAEPLVVTTTPPEAKMPYDPIEIVEGGVRGVVDPYFDLDAYQCVEIKYDGSIYQIHQESCPWLLWKALSILPQ